MADSSGDRYLDSDGDEIAQNPDAIQFGEGLDTSLDGDNVVVALKDEGITEAKFADEVVGVGKAVTLTPTATDTADVNVIKPEEIFVRLGANVTDVNDFVTLPALANVPNGHEITIIAGAANCEVRTPASSNEKINGQDSDGTKEYLLTATQVHKFVKIDNTIGWMGHGYSAIGAVVTAVVPD